MLDFFMKDNRTKNIFKQSEENNVCWDFFFPEIILFILIIFLLFTRSTFYDFEYWNLYVVFQDAHNNR